MILFVITLIIASLVVMIFTIKEFRQYMIKRKSLHGKTTKVEEIPRYQGQILDISENATDNTPAIGDFKHNKYSLGGIGNANELDEIDVQSRGSEFQNKDAAKDHIEMIMKGSQHKENIRMDKGKIDKSNKNQISSDMRDDEEELQMPSQKHKYAKMVKKNLQIEVIDYEEPEESNPHQYQNPNKEMNDSDDGQSDDDKEN